MRTPTQAVGRNGEDRACEYLRSLGHTIVARNWRSSHLELDIVSVSGDGLHIVEVKSRMAPVAAEPQANFTPTKRQRLVAAAKAFLHSPEMKSLPSGLEVFFDVITVVFEDGTATIDYFPQAFIPIYA